MELYSTKRLYFNGKEKTNLCETHQTRKVSWETIQTTTHEGGEKAFPFENKCCSVL